MATTTNYGWTKPTVGGDAGAWGGELNTDLDGIDATVFAVSGVANAALPKAGGALTGRVDTKTATLSRSDLGSVSGTVTLDLSVAQYFTLTVGGIVTLALSNVPVGTFAIPLFIRMTNAGSNVVWFSGAKFPSGIQPAWSAAGTDLVAFVTDDGGATWRMAGAQLLLE